MPGVSRIYLGGLSYKAGDRDVEHFFRKYGSLKEISLKNGYAFVEFRERRDAEDAVYDLHGVDFLGERVTVELAKGTPHGRDKERWGHPPRGDRSSRSRSPEDRRRGGQEERPRYREDGPPRGGGGDRGEFRGRNGERPMWLDKYGPPTRTDYRLTVENLSSRVSWQDLKDFMRTAGEGLQVTYADAHKVRRNEGTVEFASRSDMEKAVDKLDDTELNGRRIRLIPEKAPGGQGPSGQGGARGSPPPRRRQARSSSDSRSRSRKKSRSRSLRTRSRSGGRRTASRSRSREAASPSPKPKAACD